MVTPDKERGYVGGAFIALNEKMRERLSSRVNARAKPLKGVKVKPGTQWLKPGLVCRGASSQGRAVAPACDAAGDQGHLVVPRPGHALWPPAIAPREGRTRPVKALAKNDVWRGLRQHL
jgi:hypothetical protein